MRVVRTIRSMDLVSQDLMLGRVFRTIGSLDLVSQDLMSDEGCQSHCFPEFSVSGSDVRWWLHCGYSLKPPRSLRQF